MNRYVIPVLLIVLSLCIYQFYIVQLRADLKGLDEQSKSIEVALKEADDANKKLATIIGHFESLPADTQSKLDQLVPIKTDPTLLLIETTDFLEKNGFSAKGLSAVSNESKEKVGQYKTHITTYSISSSYRTFKTFLDIIEKSMALRDVVGVSFDTALGAGGEIGSNTDTTIHSYSLRVMSYSLR